MAKRIAAVVVLLAAMIEVFWNPFGHSTASTAPATTATPTAIQGMVLPTPTATGTPNHQAFQLLADAVSNTGTTGPLRIQFTGSDAGGTLSMDLVSNGAGALSGTYTRSGVMSHIIVIGKTIYMDSPKVVTSYTGIPVSPSTRDWIKLRTTTPVGFLGTLESSVLLRSCLRTFDNTFDAWQQTTSITVNGKPMAAYAPIEDDPAPWMLGITGTDAAPQIGAVDFVLFDQLGMPPECMGNDPSVVGQVAGPTGTIWISSVPASRAVIRAPQAFTAEPEPVIQPDPHLPSLPQHSASPTSR